METTTISSDQARAKWREMLDITNSGNNIVIERYGKPTAALIPYQDFIELTEVIEELQDIREARAALAEWQQNPDSFTPWAEVKEALAKEDDEEIDP